MSAFSLPFFKWPRILSLLNRGPKKVQLLELFTSEGCSSCPPAEASLSRLVNDSRLWREFVPVAFHVDYWDRFGWKDPFASVEWTKRQQTYAENWKAETVYTPAFVLNGREWRKATIPVVNDAAPGVFKATVQDSNTVMICRRYHATPSHRRLAAGGALMGNQFGHRSPRNRISLVSTKPSCS